MCQDSYSVTEVFTPTTAARLTFVERDDISRRLVDALRTPGKSIIVYGHTGSGKTTLVVNKLNQVYENHIISRYIRGMTFDDLLRDAFDQLDSFIDEERTSSRAEQLSSEISAGVGFKAQIAGGTENQTGRTERRVVPAPITPQTLGRHLARNRCCWVVEDFHKAEPRDKKKLAEVMKNYMDMAAPGKPALKIVAVGTVDTGSEVVMYEPDMRKRVAEIFVPLMTNEELKEIARKGSRYLNVSIKPDLQENIARYANGLASVCHHLCLNMCTESGIECTARKPTRLGDEELTAALELYCTEASDTTKDVFDKAYCTGRSNRYDNCRLIIDSLVLCGQDGGTRSQITARVKEREPDYPERNLTRYLKQLQSQQRGSLLRFDDASGRYCFTEPIFRTFASAHMNRSAADMRSAKVGNVERTLHKIYRAASAHGPRKRDSFESFLRKDTGDGDRLARLIAGWLSSGREHDKVRQHLLREVGPDRPTQELAFLLYTLDNCDLNVSTRDFFRACNRWPSNRPPLPRMVRVKAGSFLMGSAARRGKEWERPQHSVKISSFRIGVMPVTEQQYADFDPHYKVADPQLPAVLLSWWEAWLFCRWAGGFLPTEAQWEYACRAGTQSLWWIGDRENELRRAAWYDEDVDGEPHHVGSKEANQWGINDVHGNVWEWCADWHGEYSATPGRDPVGPESGIERIMRGGCSSSRAEETRSANRGLGKPRTRSISIGFRLALPAWKRSW